jgi:uncharacterized membrane protein
MTGRRSERGSISIMAAGGLVTAILAVALAADLGRLVWSRRELQAIADLAALDAVRSLGECGSQGGDVVAAAAASAKRNGFTGDTAALLSKVQLGSLRSVGGIREFEPVANFASAYAVRVEAMRETPFALVAKPFLGGDIPMRAVAVARQRAAAALRTGAHPSPIDVATAALIDGLLAGLLGTSPDLAADDYQAFIDDAIPLGALLEVEPPISRAETLLETDTAFSVFLERVAAALDRRGGAAAAPLHALAAKLPAGPADFALGDLIALEPGIEEEAREASLSVFDLVLWGAMVANGSRTITVDPLPLSSPSVARARLLVRISDPPRIAIGPAGVDETGEMRTEVSSPGLRGEIDLEASAGVPLLAGAVPRVQLFLDLRPATARLSSIRCARFDDPLHSVTVSADGGGARIGVGDFESFDDPPMPSTLLSTSLPSGETIVVRADADVAIDGVDHAVVFDGPFPPQIAAPSSANTQRVGSDLDDAVSSALRSAASTSQVTVVGSLPVDVPREELIEEVSQLLAGMLETSATVVTPLLGALGATIGGQDVTVSMVIGRPPELVR